MHPAKHAAALALAAGLAAAAAAAAASDLPKTQINVVGNLGITTQSKTIEGPFWNEQVTKASGGAITAKFSPWNEMGLKGPEVFRLLSNGVMNIATAQLGHHAGDAPINDGNDIAGLSPDMTVFRKVTDAFEPVLAAYYRDKLGLKILSMQSYQAQILYCRSEFKQLADLKGRRVRTSGASQADFVEHFGGAAVNMAFGEVQQALQQGVLDCAITGTLGGYAAGWYEGARYLYTLPVNFGAGATVTNLAWWNKQPPAVQAFLEKELDAVSERMWKLNVDENEMGIACNTTGPCPQGKPGGMVRVDASEADLKLRREAMLQSVLPKWGKRCGDACVAEWNATVGKVVDLSIGK